MKIGIKSLQDFMAFLVRRKWWVIAPFVALSCIVAVLTKQLPRVYISDSLVLIRPRDVPTTFVMDLISGSTEQRLRSIQQTVLSRGNLVAILNEFGADLPEFRPLNIDEAVAKLRNQIKVDFDMGRDASGAPIVTSFRISYQHKSPEMAQKIDSKLTSLFIEQDSRARATHVYGTTDFLAAELEKKTAELKESDERLKVLKSRFQSELPEQLETNLRFLDRLNDEKRSNGEALDRAANQRFTLQEIIADTQEFLPLPPPTPAAARKKARIEEYRTAKANFERLQALLKPTHPDLQSAQALISRLKARLSPDELDAAAKADKEEEEDPATPESTKYQNPEHKRLSADLRALDTEMKLRQADKARIEADIAKYTRKVENTPQVELELVEAVRQNGDLRAYTAELSTYLNKAQVSQSLESKQRGSQFMIIDPANYPLEPAKPNKVAVLIGGVAFSLAVSIGIALLVDIARQRVWTQSEIESLWGVPVMVDIPQILTDSDLAVVRRKKWVFAASSLAAMAVFSVCLYGIYLKHNSILQHLDPVLQRLVYR
jgi:polysaccharide biosynthesis transport protein